MKGENGVVWEGYYLLHQQSFEAFWCLRRSTGTFEGKRDVFFEGKKCVFWRERLGLREGTFYCINKVLKLFGALEEAQVRLKGKEACFEGKMHLFRRARPVAKAMGGGGS